MNSNTLNSLRLLITDIDKKYDDPNMAEESNRLLTQFNTHLEKDQINSSELGSYLLFIFHKEYGLTKFMSVVYPKQSFRKPMCQCLEILYLLINNFPAKIGKFIKDINEVCLLILRASNASSNEKVKAVSLIILGFERIPLDLAYIDHCVDIYKGLQSCLTFKIGDSISEKVYECLGLYIKLFDYTVNNQEQCILRNSMFFKIKEELMKSDHSKKLVSGLFTGLTHIFERVPFEAVEDKMKIDELYKFIKTLADNAEVNTIRTSSRAALLLLQQNMDLFVDKVFSDQNFWHTTLIKWLIKLGEKEKKVASNVLLTVYLYITKHFIKEKEPKFKSMLKNYLIFFRKGMDKTDSTYLQKQIYIHSIRIFFAAAPELLTEIEMSNFSTKLLNAFETTYVNNPDASSDDWSLLPHYIQMITSVIMIGKVPNEVELIKQSLILMLETYYNIPILHRSAVVEAFLRAIYFLHSEEFFDSFLFDLIYQSVIRSCSHKHVSELELSGNNLITVKDYMYFWNSICKMEFDNRYDEWGMDIEKRKHIFQKIVEKLMLTLFVSVNKLDVTMAVRHTKSTDIKDIFKINDKNDFVIFLNIVDFYEEMFTKINCNILRKFIQKLLNFLMEKSSLYPMVSGFYKLLAACLKVANNMNYFHSSLNVEVNEPFRRTCFKYIRALLPQILRFRDELLISSLNVLLEYPRLVLQEMLPDLTPLFIVIFTIGRNYLPVATLGIKTLETWQNKLDDRMEHFLYNIVPALDAFLRSKSLAYSTPIIQKNIKTSRALVKRKMVVEIEPELLKVQRRMLRFVGKQSIKICEGFIECPRVVTDNCGTTRYLKVTMSFEDVKLNIFLDKLVPKVVELALYCTDRKTRIMACELLHALVILFLGTTKQMTDSGQSELEGLLRKISFALLELGCDADIVVKKLFEPLFLQMLHWYSSPLQYKKCHTAVIIETLTDGVCSSTNTNLRSFSGKCIGEFVNWTIKQSYSTNSYNSKTRLVDEPGCIKAFVKKMRYFSSHPDCFKKLGAALIFNNLYVFLREEKEMFSMFWIEIFQIFVSSLNHIEVGPEYNIISDQIFAALKHLQRGFTEKSEVFNKPCERRRKPDDFRGTLLENVAEYLVANISSSKRICREKCTELFGNIIPFVTQNKTPVKYFTFIGDPKNWLKTNFKSLTEKFRSIDTNRDEIELSEWISELERCLDGFLFLLKNDILKEENLETMDTFLATKCYLEHIACTQFESPWILMDEQVVISTSTAVLSLERESINRKILKFCYYSCARNCQISSLWSVHLWRLVYKMIFNAGMRDREELEMFFKSCMPLDKITELAGIIKDNLQGNFFQNLTLDSKPENKEIVGIKALLFLQNSTLSQVVDFNDMLPFLVRNFLTCYHAKFSTNRKFTLDDVELNFYSSVLEFGLKNKDEFRGFVDFLYVSYEEDADKKIDFGMWLLNSFEETAIFNILNNFDEFLNLIVQRTNQMDVSVRYLKKILTFLCNCKKSLIQSYITIFDKLYDVWNFFDAYFCGGVTALSEGLEILKLVNLLSRSNFCVNWLESLIARGRELGFLNDNIHLIVEVLNLFFERYNPTSGQDCSKIRTELDHILSQIEKTSEENSRSLLIIKISRLFRTLQKSKSSILFEFVVKAYLEFPETEDLLKDTSTCQKLMLNVPDNEQIRILEIIVNVMKSTKYSLVRRIKHGKDILVAVFQGSKHSVFEDFFVLNLRGILKELREELCRDNIGNKTVNFLLVELLFARLPVGEDNELNKRLQIVAFDEYQSVKQLLRFCLKYALNAFKERVVLTDTEQEFLRLYRCCSYNTLVSIAINALNDPNFHVKLFARMENGEDILWKGLVDTKKKYSFEKDFNALPQKKNILVSIRRRMEEHSAVKIAATESIRSQRIFNSSLSEDITRYDMTNVTVRSEMPSNSDGFTEIELDRVAVNDHECMATICVLINHLTNTSFRNVDDSCGIEDIPDWLKGLRAVLMNNSTSVNAKIFLMKIIENTSHIFINYSNYFLAPVLKFLVDKCAGDDINFFITDLVVMLANWSEKAVPHNEMETELATSLIVFLFDKLSLERRDMFKYNIQLIKIILQAWKDVIRIPIDFLRRVEPTSQLDKEVEIHLCSVLLINDLFVFEHEHHIKFLNFLTRQLNSSKRSTYIPCSETLGLLLRKWNAKNVASGYSDIVEPVLRTIWESDKDKGGYILEGITIHYPGFIKENHVVRLLSRLNTVTANSQHVFLKIMTRAPSVLGEVSEFKSESWEKYINSGSLEVQVVTLNLMMETLDILDELPIFGRIIGSICEKTNSQNDLCKKLSFDILIKICTENSKNPDKFSAVIEMCKNSLIDGLSVEDPDLLNIIRNFWCNSSYLSNFLLDRFLQTISIFYKPKNEHVMLGSSIYFLVNLLEKDEDFDKELFDHPLEDCRFEDYELSEGIGTHNSYCVPMFAETFLDTYATRPSQPRFELGELRATQDDLSFAPTLPTNKNDTALSSFVSSQSQLFFDGRESPDGPVFKNIKEFSFKVPKRRFFKDKSKISDICANLEIESNIQKGQKRISRAKERDRKVCISRKYRKGDFPDIQIPFSSLIVTLQMLASENSDIAQILYVEIFENMKNKLDNNHWSRLSESIADIFKSSVQFNTNFFRALLDVVIISESKILIDPYLITNSCLSSGLLSAGTLIIEGYIRNMDEIPETKKSKGVDLSEESIYWIKLAELYMEMNEWDLVCSIFQDKVSCVEQLNQAIAHESKKCWADSQTYYQYLVKNHLTVDKRDFYYEAYFRSFANLGQWEELATSIKSMETPNQDYWDALWDEDWKQKKLLPWLMRAEVADMLYKQKPSQEFFENVNRSLYDTHKAEILNTVFPDQLGLMWVINGDFDTAEAYLESYANSFLGQWQILDPMFRSMRLDRIMNLQEYSTICEFIDAYRKIGCADLKPMIEWLRVLQFIMTKGVPHSLVRHEKRVLFYKQLASLTRSKILSLEDPEALQYIPDVNETMLDMDLGLVGAALGEDNYYMARKYLMSHKNTTGLDMYKAKLRFIRARSFKHDPKKMLNEMLKSVEGILRYDIHCGKYNDFVLSAHFTSFEILNEVRVLLSSNPGLLEEFKPTVSILIGTNVNASEDLSDFGAQRLSNFLISRFSAGDINKTKKGEAYFKLAQYTSQRGNFDSYDMYVLRAMQALSKEAIQLFPCLLLRDNVGQNRVFIEECSMVPTWMFLRWIPQLLATFNCDTEYAVGDILLNIAHQYPHALMYSYRLSRENFVNSCFAGDIIQQLDKLLLNHVTDMFLKAIGNVVTPSSLLLYYINRIIEHAKVNEMNEVMAVCEEFCSKLFECDPDSADPSKFQGNVYKKMSDYKKHFEEICLLVAIKHYVFVENICVDNSPRLLLT
ncbi:hypothetical protein WA026_005374 [Henosepilachna vigintioctopunctata]|uniref:DNA-dependent protein kinase catalytic subunit CC3 domain-containing protein n=1 Tax=Henosepilachna vigintioctopunctata TaxID=420089 RepID=A0AAW1U3L0_9CUCU